MDETPLIDTDLLRLLVDPLTGEKLEFVDDKLGDSPKMVSATRELSQRTKNFVNRFKLLHHTSLESFFSQSGFSATLFQDTQATSKDSEYISQLRVS